MNGLMIKIDEFEKLPNQQKLNCLYQNQVETMNLIKGYKFYQKITALIGGFLVLGIGILFKLELGIK